MKTIKKIAMTFILIHFTLMSISQMVGIDAFLIGNYVEIGINGAGGFEGADYNTSSPPISGLHYRSGNPYLGMVSDQFMAGWSGSSWDGDFYTPGSPENGWGIEIFDTTTDTIITNLNNNRSGWPTTPEIPGAITSYSYAAGYTNVVWEGNCGSGYDVDIKLTFILGDNDLFYTTYVDIINNGPQNIEEFYFYRNIDPDNNQSITGSFYTSNVIHGQRNFGDPFSMVTADQTTPWYSLFGFYSTDTNSRVCKGGFSNRDGSDLWNGIGFEQTIGDTNYIDESVALVFMGEGLTSLTKSPGSSELHFSYITILAPQVYNYLISHASTTEIETMEVKVYPNPANDFISVSSNENIKQITVHNAFGQIVYRDTNLNSNATQINTSGFSTGMYYITLQGENSAVVKKVIKK